MEEENLKLKKSNNRKKALIVILIFIIVLMGLLVFIFFCQKKEEAKPADNKQEEKKEETKTTTPVILLEKFDDREEECENNYSMEFNNIKVEVTKGDYCFLKTVKVNGKELFNESYNDSDRNDGFDVYLNSIEFYDHYVLFATHAAGDGSGLLIYNTKTDKKEYYLRILSEDLNRYFEDYESDTKGLTIESWECSLEQCGPGDTSKGTKVGDLTYASGHTNATYRMDYVDGSFTAPKLVKEYNK